MNIIEKIRLWVKERNKGKCPICRKQTLSIRTLYKNGRKIEGCYSCTNKNMTWWYDPRMKDYSYMHGKGLSIGYIKEVENRAVDRRTGEVYDARTKRTLH